MGIALRVLWENLVNLPRRSGRGGLLLPAAMTGAGLLGLKAAAGPSPSWLPGATLALPGRFDVLLSWRSPGQPDGSGYKPVTVQAPPAALRQLIRHANRLGLGPVPRQVMFSASGRPPGHSMSLAQALRSAAHLARTLTSSAHPRSAWWPAAAR